MRTRWNIHKNSKEKINCYSFQHSIPAVHLTPDSLCRVLYTLRGTGTNPNPTVGLVYQQLINVDRSSSGFSRKNLSGSNKGSLPACSSPTLGLAQKLRAVWQNLPKFVGRLECGGLKTRLFNINTSKKNSLWMLHYPQQLWAFRGRPQWSQNAKCHEDIGENARRAYGQP